MGLIQDVLKRIDDTNLLSQIEELYTQFGGRKKVADLLGVSYNTVGHIVKHYGLQPTRHERRSIEKYRGTFNNPLDDPEFGEYFKGYFLGDGSIINKNGKIQGLNLSSSDYEHLVKIRDRWDSRLPIKGPVKGNYTIDCYDSSLAQQFVDLGFTPAKSKLGMTLNFPITWHFLRGLFDSDGSISFMNHGTGRRIMWCGHPSYMSQVSSYIGSVCPVHEVIRNNKLVLCHVFKSSDIKQIRDLMYKDATIFLQRKYDRFYSF